MTWAKVSDYAFWAVFLPTLSQTVCRIFLPGLDRGYVTLVAHMALAYSALAAVWWCWRKS